MRTKIGGVLQTEVYAMSDGCIAIEQVQNTVVRLAADELPTIITELQAYYDNRTRWQDPMPG
jgi:hypothetical protein